MKKVFFALILSFFVPSIVWAEDKLAVYKQECLDFISRPKVEVYGAYGKLEYNYEKNSDYLTSEQIKKVKEYSQQTSPEMKVLGWTQMQSKFDLKANFVRLALSNGYNCFYPESLEISIEYDNPTIYIAKELEVGTCLYDTTLRHERTHAQIYIEALDYFLPRLKQYADALFDSVGIKIIAKGESLDNAMVELSEAYRNAIQKRVDSWYRAIETEQLKMDTLEQYTLESNLCREIEASKEEEF